MSNPQSNDEQLITKLVEILETCTAKLEQNDPQSVETLGARDVLNRIVLIRKIKSTNNGYLFAPTESEIELAKKNPNVFNYTCSLFDCAAFPHRISLK